MDWAAVLSNYGWAFVLVVNGLVGWTAWSIRHRFATTQEVASEREARVAADHALSERVLALEHRQRSAPTHEDLTRIYAKLDGLSDVSASVREAVSALQASVASMQRSVDLLNEHHLNGISGRSQ